MQANTHAIFLLVSSLQKWKHRQPASLSLCRICPTDMFAVWSWQRPEDLLLSQLPLRHMRLRKDVLYLPAENTCSRPTTNNSLEFSSVLPSTPPPRCTPLREGESRVSIRYSPRIGCYVPEFTELVLDWFIRYKVKRSIGNWHNQSCLVRTVEGTYSFVSKNMLYTV